MLFISILAFCAAGSLILSDNRRQLLHSVQLYQPSFLYAYLAIFMQGGVIQVRILKNFSSYTTSFPQSRKLEVLSMQRCCPLYSRLKSSTTLKQNFTGIPTFHVKQGSTVVQKSVEKFHTVFQWNSVFPK